VDRATKERSGNKLVQRLLVEMCFEGKCDDTAKIKLLSKGFSVYT